MCVPMEQVMDGSPGHNADPSASLSAASYHRWSSNGSRSSMKPFFLVWPAPYVNTSVSLILTRLLKDAPPAFWGLGAERRRLHRQLWGGEDCPDILSNCLSITTNGLISPGGRCRTLWLSHWPQGTQETKYDTRFVYSSSTDATGFQTHQLLSKQLLRRPHWVEW